MSRPAARLGQVAFATGLAVAILRGASAFEEVDTWWHLREGEHILQTWSLSGTDPWAAFADRPYLATQWLPEAVAAWFVDQMGGAGVVWLRAGAIIALYLVLYALCRQAAGRLPASLAASLAVLGAGGGLNPRPQLVSFVLFALAALAWWRTMDDGRLRWWLVPLMWLWGCCHPLWMFGLLLGAMMSAFLALRARALRPAVAKILGLNLACVIALAVTPLGPRLLIVPLDVAGNASWIAEEWRATPLNNIFSVVTLTMLVVTAVLWAWRPAGRPAWHYATLGLALLLTLWMWRLVPLGCVLGAPLFASALQGRLTRPAEGRSLREWRWVAAAGGLALAFSAALAAGPSSTRAQTYPGDTTRIDAALDALPDDTTVLNDFGISGWLLWRHPTLRPVVDLRVEIYSAPYLRAYIRTENARPGWERFVADSGAHVAVLEAESPIRDALQNRQGWQVTASQSGFVVLTDLSP